MSEGVLRDSLFFSHTIKIEIGRQARRDFFRMVGEALDGGESFILGRAIGVGFDGAKSNCDSSREDASQSC